MLPHNSFSNISVTTAFAHGSGGGCPPLLICALDGSKWPESASKLLDPMLGASGRAMLITSIKNVCAKCVGKNTQQIAVACPSVYMSPPATNDGELELMICLVLKIYLNYSTSIASLDIDNSLHCC